MWFLLPTRISLRHSRQAREFFENSWAQQTRRLFFFSFCKGRTNSLKRFPGVSRHSRLLLEIQASCALPAKSPHMETPDAGYMTVSVCRGLKSWKERRKGEKDVEKIGWPAGTILVNLRWSTPKTDPRGQQKTGWTRGKGETFTSRRKEVDPLEKRQDAVWRWMGRGLWLKGQERTGEES